MLDLVHHASCRVWLNTDVDSATQHDDLIGMPDVIRAANRQMDTQRHKGSVADQGGEFLGSPTIILPDSDHQVQHRSHPLDHLDAEQVETALDRAGGEVAQQQAARAQLVRFCLQHGAVLEEIAVAAG